MERDIAFVKPTSLFSSRIFQFALVYLGLFSATLGLIGWFIYDVAQESVTRQIEATIDAEITGLAEQYNQRGLPGLIEVIRQRANSAQGTRALYLLADQNNRLLAGNLSRWPDERTDGSGWVTFKLELAGSQGGPQNYGRARVFTGDGFYLLVGHDERERTWVQSTILWTLLVSLAAAIAVSLFGGVLMSRALLRRIDAINATSREIMAGDLGRRVPASGRGDEFDRLAGNLNAMLDRIEALITGIKQVSDNIAHDLRSPLARLRSRLEVTLMEPPDAESYRVALEKTISEADHLLQTFNALLSIAQAEAGAQRRNFAEVDLSAGARDAAELYEPLAEDKGLQLQVAVTDGIRLQGDQHLLFQALVNLLDNAIKFSPPGSSISLSLRREGQEAVLAVADQGSGIPAELRKRALERFFRLEESRSTPGSGLGLSLVAAVASLHHGEILLEDNQPGLRAALHLPLDQAPVATAETTRRAAPPGAKTALRPSSTTAA